MVYWFRMRIQGQRNEQAAAGLGGLGTSSHGQRQGQAVDEEGMIGVWADESRGPAQSGRIDVGSKSLIESARREVISAPGKGAGVRQLRASGTTGGEGRFRRPRHSHGDEIKRI